MQDSEQDTNPKLSAKSDPDPTKNHSGSTTLPVTLHSAIYIQVVDINKPRSSPIRAEIVVAYQAYYFDCKIRNRLKM
jgi:hypothetical protein